MSKQNNGTYILMHGCKVIKLFVAFLAYFGGQFCMTIGITSYYATEINAENLIALALHLGTYFHQGLV